jgi:chemotaxis signal transduction protein
MTQGQDEVNGRQFSGKLAELRESFDREFSLPRQERREKGQEFLIVGAGGQRHALRLDDVLGLQRGRKIVPLPGAAAGLLGLAGIAGRLTPVFDLNALLGGSAGTEAPQWLVVCKGQWPLALAFDRFEGCVQAPREDVFTPADAAATRLTRQAVRIDGRTLCIIDVQAVVATIKESYHSR